PHVAEPEIPEPAVDQLRRRAGRRGGEVALVDERDREPVSRRGLRDAGADDAAADDEQVELPLPELRQRLRARGQTGFVHARRPDASSTSTRAYGVSPRRPSRP